LGAGNFKHRKPNHQPPEMSITELINHAGVENVEVQGVSQNLHSANVSGKNGKITLLTEPSKVVDLSLNEESEWIGILVWIPREKITNHLNK
jgi:hypothetical protein